MVDVEKDNQVRVIMHIRFLGFLLLLGLLQSCAPVNDPNAGVKAVPLSSQDYMSLSPEQKYAVSNKLLNTLYKGMPADEFFKLRDGLSSPVLSSNINHLDQVRTSMNTPEPYLQDFLDRVLGKYFTTESRLLNTRAIPMATLQELPLSKDYFHRWMAYVLSNNILFSPAFELDSVDHTDVEMIYNDHLVYAFSQGKTISEIVYNHMTSQANWRRFRSPEDNTREMMEIFLMRFVDAEVPLASIACQNWYLTDDAEDYQLRKGININTQPQTLLGRGDIVDCYDFYQAIAEHASLIPAVTTRLVNVFFADYSEAERVSISQSIAAGKPVYFEDIFKAILFSKEYLYNNPRTKTYEETLLGTGAQIDWYAWNYMFHDINDNNPGSSRPDLGEIRQNPMSYKLGRNNQVPLDSLAFAYYHKSIRDRLLLDRRNTTDSLNTGDGGWKSSFIAPESGDVDFLSEADFIHYIMLSTVDRKATDAEVSALSTIFADNAYSNNRNMQSLIVMDYVSRLSEFYTFSTIAGGN
ncbi:MAG: hypothetical protein OEX12_04975 [Gammaproteobacteria bacterium]|nr:hypothetical protein [Gammaproteobacteria bacterium]